MTLKRSRLIVSVFAEEQIQIIFNYDHTIYTYCSSARCPELYAHLTALYIYNCVFKLILLTGLEYTSSSTVGSLLSVYKGGILTENKANVYCLKCFIVCFQLYAFICSTPNSRNND